MMGLKSWVVGAVALLAVGVRAEGTATLEGNVLTLDGLVTNVTSEAQLGAASIVLKNGGGVAFGETIDVAKTYAIDGVGLSATGVVSVAAGKQVTVTGRVRLANGTLGHVFVKDGPGRLVLSEGPGAVSVPTRWIIAAGTAAQRGASFFGNHGKSTPNLVLDIREGAVWRIDDGEHCPVGALELTGGRFDAPFRSRTDYWGNTAFRGGVVAHACGTPSVIEIGGNAHLNHIETDVPFTVEPGAILNVLGCLSNGYAPDAVTRLANRLVVSGGGELRLLGSNLYAGGTELHDGTTLTVGHSAALGTGGFAVDGAVTLNVPAGVTFVCPPVTGAGTITKTGAGVATFPDVAADVTVVRAPGEGTVGAAVTDGVLYVVGGTATVDVPAGETIELTDVVEAVPNCGPLTDLVKTGAGTLVLPDADNTRKFRSLTVRAGFVRGASQNRFGGGTTTLSGGGIAVTTSFTLGRELKVSGTGWVDVPSGVVLTVTSNHLHTAGAVLTKTGAGKLRAEGHFRSLDVATNARWVADQGTLELADGALASHSQLPSVTLEVHEGATLSSTGHNPLGNLVLRGGTVSSSYLAAHMGAGATGGTGPLERMARWNPYSLNGTVTVLPSADGRPARISVRHAVCLAHAARTTVFDVRDGATLEIDALLQPGEDAAASAVQTCGLVKRGGGDLVLLRNCGAQGTVSVEGGAVRLGPDARFAETAKLRAAPGARIVLPDGSLLATAVDAEAGVLTTADIWVDASRLQAANGATVSSVPNRGTAGGAFAPFTKTTGNFVLPGSPTYVRDGINGLGALAFNGAQALALTAYTNRTQNIEVFFVGEWTYWQDAGGKGKWGGPVSFGSFAMTADDNHSKPSFSFQHAGTAVSSVNTFNEDVGLSVTHAPLAVGVPYFKHASHLGGAVEVDLFTSDAAPGNTNRASRAASTLGVDLVSIGGRLTGGGVSQTASTATTAVSGVGNLALGANNRMFIGRIGELVVFTRALTDAERSFVASYLKAKWLGSAARPEGEVPDQTGAAGLTVEVPGDACAAVAGAVAAPLADGGVVLAKTGDGRLDVAATVDSAGIVSVDAGSVAFGRTIPSRADIWFDATDASTVALDTDGKVAAVANKGRAGGAFAQAKGWNNAGPVPLPAYVPDGISGLPAVAFDGNSALILNSYTNKASARNLHVYGVFQRTSFSTTGGKGAWSGPFSFNAVGATQPGTSNNDNHVPGAFHLEETGDLVVGQYLGNSLLQVTRTFNPTATPHLFVAHQSPGGGLFAFERAEDPVASVKQWIQTEPKPIDVDVVLLGGRTGPGGSAEWTSMNNGANRMWYGRIGEFIVFTRPLGYTEECALLGYLRAKWLGKGDASAMPPAFLSGAYGPADLSAARLRLADGAALRQEGPTLALAGLASAGTTDWTRVWTGASAADLPLFAVSGDVALGTVNLDVDPLPEQGVLLSFAGEARTKAAWNLTGSGTVAQHAHDYAFLRGGTVIFIR